MPDVLYRPGNMSPLYSTSYLFSIIFYFAGKLGVKDGLDMDKIASSLLIELQKFV